MKKFKLFLPIAILFIALPTAMPAYDFFTLSLQWPPTVARRNINNFRRDFTIHGVWPDRNGVRPLQCCPRHIPWRKCCSSHNGVPWQQCCPSRPYVRFTDYALLQRLEVSWPNLLWHDIYQQFWQHEWNNHGSYSEADPIHYSYNQIQFFKLGLDLKDRHDLYGLLGDNGLIGNSTSLTHLDNLIHSHIQGRVKFVCDSQDKLMEVHICFTPARVIRNCTRSNLCPSSRLVHIPGYP